MANNSSQLWYIIHGVHVVWYTRIWGEDTPWIFIVSGSPTHARACAMCIQRIGEQTHYSRWIQGSCASCEWPNDDDNVIQCVYGTYYQSCVHAG